MAWSTSNRRERLPSNWQSIRRLVFQRDRYTCQLRLSGCRGIATEVDHITRGDNHDLSNLRAVCSGCHKIKTVAEAQEARRIKKSRRFRPIESHPGLR